MPRPKPKPKPNFTANGVKDLKNCITNPFVSCKTIFSEFHLLGKAGLQKFFPSKSFAKENASIVNKRKKSDHTAGLFHS
jgi:hypothetical protein